MCGICGIVDPTQRISREELGLVVVRMRDELVHRGPDDAGVWLSPPDGGPTVALGHRRLSIIDLSPEGRQPMGNEDDAVQVVFNGEIYGFRALRRELEAQGHRFRTRTDTEVLAHLFESCSLEGMATRIDALDGMFAFAAWNTKERRLLLARDAFGKKPLYWCHRDGLVAFASELRCFRHLPGFTRTLDEEALAEYLLVQYCHAPRTIYRDVRKVEPGCFVLADFSAVGEGGSRGVSAIVHLGRHWSFEARGPARAALGVSLDEEADALQALIVEAVRKRLMSDVPLGAFLSGGVDSSLVVAVMRKDLGREVESFSIGFSDTEDTEHEFARQTAQLLGTTHRDDVLRPDVMSLVHAIAEGLDEPNGDSSCLPTWLLCRHARQHVTVALSGDGGDELFGGYGRYRDTLNEFASRLERLKLTLRGRRGARASDLYLSPRWLIWQPEDVAELLTGRRDGPLPAAAAEDLGAWRRLLDDGALPLMHRMRALDATTYMPGAVLAKVDRMSMQHSLEVRCPLLDKAVARFAMGLSADSCWRPPTETKRILKHVAGRYLPAAWMHRRKMGFGVPANAWSPKPFIDLARGLLLSDDALSLRTLDRQALQRRIDQMEQPGCFSIYRLWPLVILELWLRRQAA
jgi:asparagine synthase (glutamine-hydrolysing)